MEKTHSLPQGKTPEKTLAFTLEQSQIPPILNMTLSWTFMFAIDLCFSDILSL